MNPCLQCAAILNESSAAVAAGDATGGEADNAASYPGLANVIRRWALTNDKQCLLRKPFPAVSVTSSWLR